MSRLAKLSAVGIVGFGLTVVGSGATEPVKDLASSSGTSATPGPKAPERLEGEATSKRGEGTGDTPGSGLKTTAAGSPARAGGGGYSWSEKKGRVAGRAKAQKIDPALPLAQAPTFEVRPDGTSVVRLSLSQRTEVKRTGARRRLEYRLKNAQVGVANNMNPLVTSHFPTPLQRVVLRRANRGAVLILELREAIDPLHELRGSPAGAFLEITLPKPSRAYPARTASAPPTREAKDSSPAARDVRSSGEAKREAARLGPGPRL